MRRYSCGCQVADVGEDVPGVAFTFTDPNPLERAGWFKQTNTRDGEHLVKPCEKHIKGVIVRWGTNKIMNVVGGQ